MYITWPKRRPPSAAAAWATFVGGTKLLACCFNLANPPLLPLPLPPSDASTPPPPPPPPRLSRSLSPSLGNIASNLSGRRTDRRAEGRTDGQANARAPPYHRSFARLAAAATIANARPRVRRTRRSWTSGGQIHSARESPGAAGAAAKICQLPRSLLSSCPSRVVRAICWTGRTTPQLPLLMTAPRRPPAAVADFHPVRYTLTLTFLPSESSRFPPLPSRSRQRGPIKRRSRRRMYVRTTARVWTERRVRPPRAPELYSGQEKGCWNVGKKRSPHNTISLVLWVGGDGGGELAGWP